MVGTRSNDPTGSTDASSKDTDDRYDVHTDIIDGSHVVHKQATGPDRKTLRREASALAQIGSSHVVRLIELNESESLTDMVTADAGSRTLADQTKIAPLELLRALRDCVEGLRELHMSGWEHGGLSPDHVIVGARGRVRLCSLSAAKRLPMQESEGSDPGIDATSRRDVSDLLGMIDTIAGSTASDRSWLDRRERQRLNRQILHASAMARDALRSTGSPREVLNYLDEMLGEVSSTPARSAAHQSRHGRSGRRTHPGTVGSRSHPIRQRSAAGALVIGAVLVGVVAIGSVTSRAYGTSAVEARPRPSTVERATIGNDITPTTSSATSSTTSEAVADSELTTLDVTPPLDNVVMIDGTTYSVGDRGDVAMAGDWSCDGRERAVLLRPSSGELFIFDVTARPGSPSTGRLIAIHPDAVRLDPLPERCGTISLLTADQSVIVVPLMADNSGSPMDSTSDTPLGIHTTPDGGAPATEDGIDER